jgi:hypothetical protein
MSKANDTGPKNATNGCYERLPEAESPHILLSLYSNLFNSRIGIDLYRLNVKSGKKRRYAIVPINSKGLSGT